MEDGLPYNQTKQICKRASAVSTLTRRSREFDILLSNCILTPEAEAVLLSGYYEYYIGCTHRRSLNDLEGSCAYCIAYDRMHPETMLDLSKPLYDIGDP